MALDRMLQAMFTPLINRYTDQISARGELCIAYAYR